MLLVSPPPPPPPLLALGPLRHAAWALFWLRGSLFRPVGVKSGSTFLVTRYGTDGTSSGPVGPWGGDENGIDFLVF